MLALSEIIESPRPIPSSIRLRDQAYSREATAHNKDRLAPLLCRCLHRRSAKKRSQHTLTVHSLSLSCNNAPAVPASLTTILGTKHTHYVRPILNPVMLTFRLQGSRLTSHMSLVLSGVLLRLLPNFVPQCLFEGQTARVTCLSTLLAF